jgi:quinol monooxygenase YgiN
LQSGPTQILPSCISSPRYQDIDHPDAPLLVEEWESRADLEVHIASDKFFILSLMKLSAKLLQTSFETVSRAECIKVVEAVRA